MRSIHKKLAVGLVLLAPMFVAGCGFTQRRENSPPAAQVDPVPPDEAMQKRDWAQATAAYPDGAVAAGPTDFNYEPKRGRPEVHYYYDDTATFVVNMVLLPYNLFKHPPTEVKIYAGETCLPSYTAQPVLPPALVAEPGTPPVTEPGTEPTTPNVVEPGAMPPPEPATATTPAVTPETPATPQTPATPPTPESPAPAPTAPAPPAEPAPAPAAPTAAQPEPAAPAAAPAPAPEPAATPAPAPTPEPAPNPGETAPSTPHVIEPPPPQATKNLAPPMPRPASTQPYLNK